MLPSPPGDLFSLDVATACALCLQRTCKGAKRDKSRYWSLEASAPVLVLSLKRFGINYANMSRFKINSKFEFPLVMDVGALKRRPNTGDEGAETTGSDKDSVVSGVRSNMIWLEQLKTKSGELEARRRYTRLTSRNHSDVYELYGIVIHSGAA